MSDKRVKLTKLYYSIGEVADMFEVNASLIRFWEKEFKEIKPKKNKKGNRLFTVKDIHHFEKIYDLVKVKGFTLEGAKNHLKHHQLDEVVENQPSPAHLEVMERLEKVKLKLIALKNEIE